MSIFVVSDIHGMYDEFEQLLEKWDQQSDLVILGDLADRGPRSLDVIYKVIELKEEYGDKVHFIMGNHDEMLLEYIEQREEKVGRYMRNGGDKTITSLFAPLHIDIDKLTEEEQLELLRDAYEDELSFIRNAPRFEIIGNVLFTHAGFDSTLEDFKNTTDNDFVWIRKHYESPNPTPYVNVFGHTPANYIHERFDIWLSEDKRYIAVDGGCVYGGQLNGLLLSEDGEVLETYVVPSSIVAEEAK